MVTLGIFLIDHHAPFIVNIKEKIGGVVLIGLSYLIYTFNG
jgi:hypothetical protein